MEKLLISHIISLILLLFFPLNSNAQISYPMPNCSGFQYNGTMCTTSSLCNDPRCLTCSSTSLSDCILCNSVYNLTRSQGQGSCIIQCNSTQLSTSHYMISSPISNNIEICSNSSCFDDNCYSCLSGNPDNCFLCHEGFFPRYYHSTNTSKCLNCSLAMINCLECEWNTYCTKCKAYNDNSAGFLIYNDGGSCRACEDMVTRCVKCDGQRKCLACGTGFYISDDGNHGVCQACLSNCDVCKNNSVCLQCRDNYFNISNHECKSCNSYMSNCLSCSNRNNCLQCEQGYYLKNASSNDNFNIFIINFIF